MNNKINYSNKIDRKACNKIIMDINSLRPVTKKDQIFDYAYVSLLAIFGIFVPMFSIPWLMTINKALTALIVSLISVGIAVTIGLSRRRKIIKSFYIINDAHKNVRIIDGNNKLEEIFKTNEVLLSTLPQKNCYIDLLYNWLCWRKLVIPNEEVRWYRLDCKILKPYLNESSYLLNQESVLFVTFKERFPDNLARFLVEAKILGAYFINDIK